MKTQILAGLTAAATVTTGLLSVSAPAQAASFSFGTSGISFDTNTTVDFTFNATHGSYTSAFGVYEVKNSVASIASKLFWETKGSDNGADNGWLGSFGNTVTSSTGLAKASYTFLAGKIYTLGLDSGSNGIVYSTSSLNSNSNGTQQAVFGSFGSSGADGTYFNANAYQSGNPFSSSVKIGLDDRGNGNDKDFQDFTVTASAATTVPEPLTMGGMLLGSAGLAVARRLRRRQSV